MLCVVTISPCWVFCRLHRISVEHLSRFPVAQDLVGPLVVVEMKVTAEPSLGLSSVGVGFQVDFLVLLRPPQPVHEYVVAVPPFPVHADSDPVALQESGEGLAGELVPLVSVEHLRPSLAQRLFRGLDTEISVQGVGQVPGHHVPIVPVHDGNKLVEAPAMGM